MKHTNEKICPSCEDKLKNAHPILGDWFRKYVKPNHPNAHISWSWRNEADQERSFLDDKTDLHWPNSKHNRMVDGKPCSYALDLFEQVNGKAIYSHAFFKGVYEDLKSLALPIQWGGLWKKRGDGDHFEINESMHA